jgi:hypothetical protein
MQSKKGDLPMTRQILILAGVGVLVLAGTATAQTLDYIAPPGETVLDTDQTVLQPTSGGPITVTGGVFRFRNVTVPVGSVVRGVGSHPMIWIVDNMIVAGDLTVSGEDGIRVNTLQSPGFPTPGGRGGAAGGNGGSGSPQLSAHSFAGQAGNGPGNGPGLGGTGGLIGMNGVLRGSGGGGGSFGTAGDPYFFSQWAGGSAFVQQLGIGGYGNVGASGAATRSLPGGGPGGTPFGDNSDENDFIGLGVDVFRRRAITGELTQLIGGAGGGGGGDYAPSGQNWNFDSKGGGGGGGGGCLVVVVSSTIQVSGLGSITANGGYGGGGEQAGSSNQGGGGGGGSGGLLILASFGTVAIDVHGETYANRDYDFSLSADGGVCTTGTFGTPVVSSKYPANGQPVIIGPNYDSAPLGAFGGMGVIEIMTRVGVNADLTNTLLDDNIILTRNGVQLSGATKQRYLAWRGYENASGVRVDDFGNPTNIGRNDGDMRPAPILLPIL